MTWRQNVCPQEKPRKVIGWGLAKNFCKLDRLIMFFKIVTQDKSKTKTSLYFLFIYFKAH